MKPNNFEKVSDSIFKYNPTSNWPHASEEMIEDFVKNGFVILKNLFNSSEIQKANDAFKNCDKFWKSSFSLNDLKARTYYQAQWLEPGDDIMGMFARNVKTVGVAEEMLARGELYMYSGKVIMKQERTGGSVIWHQDYGYWYNNRAIFPDFITCVIALTKSDRENGGLQLLKGSHLCGRIDHGKKAGQTGADMERVEMIMKNHEHIYANLAPGDALFFHGNILHHSDENDSDFKRYHLIFSYNCKHNSPDRKHYNAIYEKPLEKVPADSVSNLESIEIADREYLDPHTNPNITMEKGYH